MLMMRRASMAITRGAVTQVQPLFDAFGGGWMDSVSRAMEYSLACNILFWRSMLAMLERDYLVFLWRWYGL